MLPAQRHKNVSPKHVFFYYYLFTEGSAAQLNNFEHFAIVFAHHNMLVCPLVCAERSSLSLCPTVTLYLHHSYKTGL